MEEKKHAILIVKNKDGKYLQYYDERWNSFLFLNCKMDNDFDDNQIVNIINERFGIFDDSIMIHLLDDKIHKKFSIPFNKEKEYHHYFYGVEFNLADEMMNDKFEKDGNSYQWFSIEELEKDDRIQEVNSDIVGYVKKLTT